MSKPVLSDAHSKANEKLIAKIDKPACLPGLYGTNAQKSSIFGCAGSVL